MKYTKYTYEKVLVFLAWNKFEAELVSEYYKEQNYQSVVNICVSTFLCWCKYCYFEMLCKKVKI
jgi:hypothetical protein